jgi:hypothetical protein
MGLTLGILEGQNFTRKNHHGVGPRRAGAAELAPSMSSQRNPLVGSGLEIVLTRSGVPTPSSGATSKSSSPDRGVPARNRPRPDRVPPQGVFRPQCPAQGPGAHGPDARYFGSPKLHPEKSPRRRTTSRATQIGFALWPQLGDAILTDSTPSSRAAKNATPTIPIVMAARPHGRLQPSVVPRGPIQLPAGASAARRCYTWRSCHAAGTGFRSRHSGGGR